MKTFIVTLLVAFQASAFTSGYYNCVKGNNNSICPQKVKYVTATNGSTSLQVIYSGDCGDQGPYTYSCQNATTCGDSLIGFKKVSDTSYDWVNKNFNMNCRFELSTTN